jgi:predicted alpha/beta hydrolase family esterase
MRCCCRSEFALYSDLATLKAPHSRRRQTETGALRSSDLDLVFVSGVGGSGADHWQSRWRARLPTARLVEQSDWDRPELEAWVRNVAQACRSSTRPLVLIAHALGVTTLAHAIARSPDCDIKGAFLVAPPSDEALAAGLLGAFAPTPRAKLPFASIVVASRDDPDGRIDAAERLARDWGSDFVDAGPVGRIDAESGHGPWPEGLMSLARLLKRI